MPILQYFEFYLIDTIFNYKKNFSGILPTIIKKWLNINAATKIFFLIFSFLVKMKFIFRQNFFPDRVSCKMEQKERKKAFESDLVSQKLFCKHSSKVTHFSHSYRSLRSSYILFCYITFCVTVKPELTSE